MMRKVQVLFDPLACQLSQASHAGGLQLFGVWAIGLRAIQPAGQDQRFKE